MNKGHAVIDLNADLGEGCAHDDELLHLVTSASISCGAHAGDPETIVKTLTTANTCGVIVGAHPGYLDRESFGRREQNVDARVVEQLILDQFAALAALAAALGLTLRFVKPHGALYNQAQRDHEIAVGVIGALERLRVPLLGQPGTVLAELAETHGVRYVAEGFPDRRYLADGRLAPRSEPGAVLHEASEIEAQAVQLAAQGAATLCIHGDAPRAVENAGTVRSALGRAGFRLRSFV
jgi:UPF0271 protein